MAFIEMNFVGGGENMKTEEIYESATLSVRKYGNVVQAIFKGFTGTYTFPDNCKPKGLTVFVVGNYNASSSPRYANAYPNVNTDGVLTVRNNNNEIITTYNLYGAVTFIL